MVNVENISALCADQDDVVYISHFSNASYIHELSIKNARKSGLLKAVLESDNTVQNNRDKPIIISHGTREAFEFVIEYLGAVEAAIPPKPLPKYKPIEEIFAAELTLFRNLFDKESTERLELLQELAMLANNLDMQILLEKVCAIIAYYFLQNKQKGSK